MYASAFFLCGFNIRGLCILLQSRRGCGKIAQNEQTEQNQDIVLVLVTRSRMWIRREAKFVDSIKQYNQ